MSWRWESIHHGQRVELFFYILQIAFFYKCKFSSYRFFVRRAISLYCVYSSNKRRMCLEVPPTVIFPNTYPGIGNGICSESVPVASFGIRTIRVRSRDTWRSRDNEVECSSKCNEGCNKVRVLHPDGVAEGKHAT